MLTVFLACLHLVAAAPEANEEPLEGPGGLKVFVGKKGGAIRMFRELPPTRGPDGNKPEDDRKQPPKKGGEGGDPGDEKGEKGKKGGDRGEEKGEKKPPPKSGEIIVSFGRIQEVDSSSVAISGNHGVKKPESVDFSVIKET